MLEHSLAGELFITNNINLKTKDIHRVSLRDTLRLEGPSAITSIFVLASTSESKAGLRVFWNDNEVNEHEIGSNLKMMRFDASYQLGENDSLEIEFDANVEAVTIGAILYTREDGSRAITINPESGDPNNPGITDAELEGFVAALLDAFWEERRMDLVFEYRDYFYGKEFTMLQMSYVLETFQRDIFRIEALRVLLSLLERTSKNMNRVVDTFYHPQARRDAHYLLHRHIRENRL